MPPLSPAPQRSVGKGTDRDQRCNFWMRLVTSVERGQQSLERIKSARHDHGMAGLTRTVQNSPRSRPSEVEDVMSLGYGSSASLMVRLPSYRRIGPSARVSTERNTRHQANLDDLSSDRTFTSPEVVPTPCAPFSDDEKWVCRPAAGGMGVHTTSSRQSCFGQAVTRWSSGRSVGRCGR